MSGKSGSSPSVQVVCRIRPENTKEKHLGTRCVSVLSNSVTVEANCVTTKFNFDYIFGPDQNGTQQDVFKHVGEPVIKSILSGYNGTILAYGQTSSGKTHTMQGPSISDPNEMGIIPRVFFNLFDELSKPEYENIEFTAQISYVEIYMERIRDLLNPSSSDLHVRESPEKGIYIDGVKLCYVSNPNELLNLMEDGSHNRAVAATGMNEGSSRSHSILFLTITQANTNTSSLKRSRLCLVDLAGSEMVRKTNSEGQTLEEAKMINKSLSTLGLVINSLTDGKSTHIPYRDSKLTRVLQDSLGGNSLTTLIICCSPSSYNAAETLSTLRFGQRAKRIQNKPMVNEQKSVHELELLLQQRDDALLLQEKRLSVSESIIAKQKIYILYLTLNIKSLLLKLNGLSDDDLEEKIREIEEKNPYVLGDDDNNNGEDISDDIIDGVPLPPSQLIINKEGINIDESNKCNIVKEIDNKTGRNEEIEKENENENEILKEILMEIVKNIEIDNEKEEINEELEKEKKIEIEKENVKEEELKEQNILTIMVENNNKEKEKEEIYNNNNNTLTQPEETTTDILDEEIRSEQQLTNKLKSQLDKQTNPIKYNNQSKSPPPLTSTLPFTLPHQTSPIHSPSDDNNNNNNNLYYYTIKKSNSLLDINRLKDNNIKVIKNGNKSFSVGIDSKQSSPGVKVRRFSLNSIDNALSDESSKESFDKNINLSLMVADYSKKNKLLEDEIYTLRKEYDDCMLLIKEKEKIIAQLKENQKSENSEKLKYILDELNEFTLLLKVDLKFDIETDLNVIAFVMDKLKYNIIQLCDTTTVSRSATNSPTKIMSFFTSADDSLINTQSLQLTLPTEEVEEEEGYIRNCNDEDDDDINKWKQENEELINLNKTLKQELNKQRTLSLDMTELNIEKEKLLNENETLSKKNTTLEAELKKTKTLEIDISNITQQKKDISIQLEALKEKYNNFVHDYNKRMKKLEDQYWKCLTDNNTLQTEINTLRLANINTKKVLQVDNVAKIIKGGKPFINQSNVNRRNSIASNTPNISTNNTMYITKGTLTKCKPFSFLISPKSHIFDQHQKIKS